MKPRAGALPPPLLACEGKPQARRRGSTARRRPSYDPTHWGLTSLRFHEGQKGWWKPQNFSGTIPNLRPSLRSPSTSHPANSRTGTDLGGMVLSRLFSPVDRTKNGEDKDPIHEVPYRPVTNLWTQYLTETRSPKLNLLFHLSFTNPRLKSLNCPNGREGPAQ